MHFQVAVRSLREGRIGLQVHRDADPTRGTGGEESLRVRGKHYVPVLSLRFQMIESQGDRIFGQPSVDEQAVCDEFNPGVGQVFRVHLTVRPQMLHPQHGQQGVLPIGVDDVGTAGQMDLMQADGRRRVRRRVITVSELKNLPVRRCAVIIMGEDAGMVQFGPPDIIAGLLQEIDQVEGCFQRPERRQRVHFRRPASLQEREPAFLHHRGIIPGIPVVRINERKIVQREVQERKILDHRGPDLRKAQLSTLHILLRKSVHEGREHLRPQHHLQGDQQEQQQADKDQHEVPDDFQRFHGNKQR